jgi:hypothetical protein
MSEYRFQEFPKMKYHPKHEPIIVQNAEEENALGRGWVNTPNDFPKPSRSVAVLQGPVKKWWLEWQWFVAALVLILGVVAGIRALR